MTCEGVSYAKLITKLHELSIEDIGDPNVPLEKQRRISTHSNALNVCEKYNSNKNQKKNIFSFNGNYHWCQEKRKRSLM